MLLTCPVCQKQLPEPVPRCSRCQADISALADVMKDLQALLDQAAAHARAGEIGSAVRVYLDVLDVDPANPAARAALGDVLNTIRRVEFGRRRLPFEWIVIVLLALALTANAVVMGWVVRQAAKPAATGKP